MSNDDFVDSVSMAGHIGAARRIRADAKVTSPSVSAESDGYHGEDRRSLTIDGVPC